MKITLQDLLDFKNYSKENEEIIKSEKITVNTRHGYYPIQDVAITAKNSNVIEFITESGIIIKSSPDHLFWSPVLCEWIKAKEFK